MSELLYKIGQVFKAMFCDWIPKIINADLGIIGTISTAIAILTIVCCKAKGRKRRQLLSLIPRRRRGIRCV